MPGERFGAAISKAIEELRARDIQLTASSSGGFVLDDGLAISVLTKKALVVLDAGTVRWDDGSEPEDDLKVILLHYLLGSSGRVDGRWMSFRELESGNLYYSVFQGRALGPLLSTFGPKPELLVGAAVKLGGSRVERGDVSFDFSFFPYLKVNVTVWEGDEEVPPSANILFDTAAGRTLGAEDIAHLAEDLVEMLVRGSG